MNIQSAMPHARISSRRARFGEEMVRKSPKSWNAGFSKLIPLFKNKQKTSWKSWDIPYLLSSSLGEHILFAWLKLCPASRWTLGLTSHITSNSIYFSTSVKSSKSQIYRACFMLFLSVLTPSCRGSLPSLPSLEVVRSPALHFLIEPVIKSRHPPSVPSTTPLSGSTPLVPAEAQAFDFSSLALICCHSEAQITFLKCLHHITASPREGWVSQLSFRSALNAWGGLLSLGTLPTHT